MKSLNTEKATDELESTLQASEDNGPGGSGSGDHQDARRGTEREPLLRRDSAY